MAQFYVGLSSGSRGKGHSAVQKAGYNIREAYAYSAREDLVYKEHGNMPDWAKEDGMKFWAACDKYERTNAQLYQEHIVAIPREIINTSDQVAIIKEYITEVVGERHPYTLAIHDTLAMDGGRNPHAHIMISGRTNDGHARDEAQFFAKYNAQSPEKGGAEKDRAMVHMGYVRTLRDTWEDIGNTYLEQNGYECRLDQRSNAERGINRESGPPLTARERAMWRQGVHSPKVQAIIDTRADRARLNNITHAIAITEGKIKHEQELANQLTQSPAIVAEVADDQSHAPFKLKYQDRGMER